MCGAAAAENTENVTKRTLSIETSFPEIEQKNNDKYGIR
jgi:hypothetical protein